MGKSIGIGGLQAKKFKTYPLPGKLGAALGEIETNSSGIIWGKSGQGKTTLALQCVKLFSPFGKCYYNSVEQGISKSLQSVANHVGLAELPGSVVIFGDKDNFEEMVEKLKNNRAKFVFIDSSQYIRLTVEKFKLLIKLFPNKSFWIISWEGAGKNPKGDAADAIRYMVDVKIWVSKGVAHVDSRFTAQSTYRIFETAAVPAAQQTLELTTN